MDETGRTPLIWAAIHGQENTIKDLLELNCNPNTVDKKGRNALHYVFDFDHHETLAAAFVLLNNLDKDTLANLSKTNVDTHDLALIKRLSSILLQAGVDPNLEDKDGYTPFYYALSHNDPELVELFLNYHIEYNSTYDNVINNNEIEAMIALLTFIDNYFGNPAVYAMDNKYFYLLRYYLNHRVDSSRMYPPLEYPENGQTIWDFDFPEGKKLLKERRLSMRQI